MKITKIEAGIPIPPIRTGKISKYPLVDLHKGASFAVKTKGIKQQKKVATLLRTVIIHFSKTLKKGDKREFTIRRLKTEVRVWRTK